MDYPHITHSGLTQAEVLTRAKEHQQRMEERGYPTPLQECVHDVIDAAIEHKQGE